MSKQRVNTKQLEMHNNMIAAKQNHDGFVAMIKRDLQGKLSLIGINATGAIERTFITDVKAMYTGSVAVRLCAENIDDGQYFDMRGLTVYHTYDEVETRKFVQEQAALRAKIEADRVRSQQLQSGDMCNDALVESLKFEPAPTT